MKEFIILKEKGEYKFIEEYDRIPGTDVSCFIIENSKEEIIRTWDWAEADRIFKEV